MSKLKSSWGKVEKVKTNNPAIDHLYISISNNLMVVGYFWVPTLQKDKELTKLLNKFYKAKEYIPAKAIYSDIKNYLQQFPNQTSNFYELQFNKNSNNRK